MSCKEPKYAYITLEMGHKSTIKSHIWDDVSYVPQSSSEPTHDWEFWIRDSNNGDMSKYVERLVIHLHETFKKPSRSYHSPPFVLKEQGYAGFEIFIDLYFKSIPSNDPVKKARLRYDLFLMPAMQDLVRDPKRQFVIRQKRHTRYEQMTIKHSDSNFIKLLMAGGATSTPSNGPGIKSVSPAVDEAAAKSGKSSKSSSNSASRNSHSKHHHRSSSSASKHDQSGKESSKDKEHKSKRSSGEHRHRSSTAADKEKSSGSSSKRSESSHRSSSSKKDVSSSKSTTVSSSHESRRSNVGGGGGGSSSNGKESVPCRPSSRNSVNSPVNATPMTYKQHRQRKEAEDRKKSGGGGKSSAVKESSSSSSKPRVNPAFKNLFGDVIQIKDPASSKSDGSKERHSKSEKLSQAKDEKKTEAAKNGSRPNTPIPAAKVSKSFSGSKSRDESKSKSSKGVTSESDKPRSGSSMRDESSASKSRGKSDHKRDRGEKDRKEGNNKTKEREDRAARKEKEQKKLAKEKEAQERIAREKEERERKEKEERQRKEEERRCREEEEAKIRKEKEDAIKKEKEKKRKMESEAKERRKREEKRTSSSGEAAKEEKRSRRKEVKKKEEKERTEGQDAAKKRQQKDGRSGDAGKLSSGMPVAGILASKAKQGSAVKHEIASDDGSDVDHNKKSKSSSRRKGDRSTSEKKVPKPASNRMEKPPTPRRLITSESDDESSAPVHLLPPSSPSTSSSSNCSVGSPVREKSASKPKPLSSRSSVSSTRSRDSSRGRGFATSSSRSSSSSSLADGDKVDDKGSDPLPPPSVESTGIENQDVKPEKAHVKRAKSPIILSVSSSEEETAAYVDVPTSSADIASNPFASVGSPLSPMSDTSGDEEASAEMLPKPPVENVKKESPTASNAKSFSSWKDEHKRKRKASPEACSGQDVEKVTTAHSPVDGKVVRRDVKDEEVDINYYPVQEEHNDYIPASEFHKKDYISLLQEVQDRLANPQEGDDVQTVLLLIRKTGCFDIRNGQFIFDLCLLDKKTVKKIVKCLGIPLE